MKGLTESHLLMRPDEHSQAVVLLVDDQAIIAEAIRRMLEDEADITLHYCSDPAKAIETAKQVRPSIILQDLVMPGVSGFTLVRFYRATPELGNVPIVVLSTKEDPRDKSQAFMDGASDYLVKPPDKIELVARIRAHSRSFMAQRQRDEAYQALKDLQKQLEESNKALRTLSALDGLTGIANRRRFDEALDSECKRAKRDRVPMSLIMIDIDFFKRFNDQYGHQGGDDCLKQVAAALSDSLRRPGDLLARYGGEEFVVVLPDTDSEGASRVAEELRVRITELEIPHEPSDVAKHVTISLGVATSVDGKGCEAADIISMADEALYEAKRAGRNCCRVYSKGLQVH